MYNFIVGMFLGSLLTILPLLVWDRVARSRAPHSPRPGDELGWQAKQGNSTQQR